METIFNFRIHKLIMPFFNNCHFMHKPSLRRLAQGWTSSYSDRVNIRKSSLYSSLYFCIFFQFQIYTKIIAQCPEMLAFRQVNINYLSSALPFSARDGISTSYFVVLPLDEKEIGSICTRSNLCCQSRN